MQGTPGPEVFTPFFRYAFAVGVLAVLFPILILIGTATRLAAARREERFAALRLVGATPRDINVIASVDSVVSALLGAIAGIGLFLAIRPALAGAELTGTRYFAATVSPHRLGVPGHAGRGAGRARRSRRWSRCAGCGSRRSASAAGPPRRRRRRGGWPRWAPAWRCSWSGLLATNAQVHRLAGLSRAADRHDRHRDRGPLAHRCGGAVVRAGASTGPRRCWPPGGSRTTPRPRSGRCAVSSSPCSSAR